MKIVGEKIKFYKTTKWNLISLYWDRASQEAIDRLDKIIGDFQEIKKSILSHEAKQHDLPKDRFRSTKPPQLQM